MTSRRLARPALRAFFRIAQCWRLTPAQARGLLGASFYTYWRWRLVGSRELPPAVLERISCILGIYGALHALFPDRKQAETWIHRANRATGFGGCSALNRMLEEGLPGLHAVRTYLAAQVDGE